MTQPNEKPREFLVCEPCDSDLQEGLFVLRCYAKERLADHIWNKRVSQSKDPESGVVIAIDKKAYDRHVELNRKLANHNYDMKARAEKLAEMIENALEIMGDSTPYPDPKFQQEVTALGLKIGFGALMHSANYGWQRANELKNIPNGSEFVFGPCKSTRDNWAEKAKQVLAEYENENWGW